MDCIKDLQDAIRNILVNNGLTELCLGEPDELDDPTYIIWYDRHCEPHEDPVLKVYLENEGIAVEVEARSFGNTITVYDYDIDRIEWWKGIHANILEVLERDGKRRCPACGRTVKGKQRYCGAGCRDFIDLNSSTGDQIKSVIVVRRKEHLPFFDLPMRRNIANLLLTGTIQLLKDRDLGSTWLFFVTTATFHYANSLSNVSSNS